MTRPDTHTEHEATEEWAENGRGRRFRHGTLYGYRACGCRCETCRAAGTAYQRTYRAARKAALSAARGKDTPNE